MCSIHPVRLLQQLSQLQTSSRHIETEVETCLAALVERSGQWEKVIIMQEDGSASMANVPGSSEFDQGKLFNPEGLWDQMKPITARDIAEVRKEMWHKFDQKD